MRQVMIGCAITQIVTAHRLQTSPETHAKHSRMHMVVDNVSNSNSAFHSYDSKHSSLHNFDLVQTPLLPVF